jgi:hypothetical protein
VTRRLFWVGVGVGVTVMAARWLRRQRARYGPQNVADRLVQGTRDLGSLVKASFEEGRRAMAKKESELRASLAEPQP